MFTGIIEQKGVVQSVQPKQNLLVMAIDVGRLAKDIVLGDSVAVNGVCLTATAKKGKVISFDLMKETVEKTSLRQAVLGQPVNLELALKADSRFGGHFVTGHIDGAARIVTIRRQPNWVEMVIELPRAIKKYIVPKGSVAIDGISLTVGAVGAKTFSVYLIPYSLQITTLGLKRRNDLVNVEADLIAKYIRN